VWWNVVGVSGEINVVIFLYAEGGGRMFLGDGVNFCHLLRLDIAEGGRQLAHYSVCRLRRVDQNYLESFEMWCRRRKEKIIWIGRVKCEEVACYERSRRSGISNKR
jgi:hypothetical protein